ncbi:MAG: zinc-dependent peptidase [Planctomycetaceae bacterium]|jgi:Mlc titration factor MtfA (ptsG expression regulator)|nr:zinc-dependent peptidase [Phycisphaerales bacterium]MCE2654630.1 zinc-dependent peptidase [Planctomycetaceae bacterium]
MLFRWFRDRRRAAVRARPFPPAWQAILRRRFAHWHRLSEADRRELLGHIAVFLAEKRFEGCNGLTVTDEMRVLVAAQACLLLLHRDTDYFPGCPAVLLYPAAFARLVRTTGPGGVVHEGITAMAGESWNGLYAPASGGPVVLAWTDVQRGAQQPDDGRNVVLHEFAHQLDGESGGMDGTPRLPTRTAYAEWARVMTAEYRQLLADIRAANPTLIDRYGAQNPSEFFAVLTEQFFEQSANLKARHPGLYQQLADFYRQDPANWHPADRLDDDAHDDTAHRGLAERGSLVACVPLAAHGPPLRPLPPAFARARPAWA